jgi:uncharacterized protein YdhG (YjbR/CyaY superfamily)
VNTINSYINQFKGETKVQLENLYFYLKQLIPDADEQISYNMPCLKQNNKPLVYFAGYKGHIGFYPTAKPIVHFKELLMSYKTSKGAIQFNINEPLPIELIKEITCFRLNQLNS